MKKAIVKNLPSLEKARRRRPERINYECFTLDIPPLVEEKLANTKFFIRTYGCQANVRDEESMAGLLNAAKIERTENVSEAKVIILNTCAIRENAEQKLFGQVGNLKQYKTKDKDTIIIVAGCMVQQESSLEKLYRSYPQVDIFMGTNSIHKLLGLLNIHLETKKKVFDVTSEDITIYEDVPTYRIVEHKAFVNITYGCDKFCTYCIVPYTRGKERSRKVKDILNECRILIASGYQEITLVGQNVNAYGLDLKDGTTFSYILEEVAKLGIPRLRFITSHPWNFDDEMIAVIAKYPNIMKKIHLPLQSGSDEILRLMGRRYTVADYRELVAKLRAKMPNIALTTDIIVGFPNETEEQFQATLDVVSEITYAGAFTFIYSPRKGTPAARMVDNVTKEAKHLRFNKLKDIVEEQTADYAEQFVGQTLKVLVDGVSKRRKTILTGYSEEEKVVHFAGPRSLIGEIIEVKITESRVFALWGERVE
ncbi:MAG TPA: tRNA (N6-isopentenyl adenosine(37)-C2)-methylthiotransferase MiaB [Bacilli bacterium]|nr:tRNA (N6-isopentenyl adenosine(37)-C2)-methylthiotransferase MiaB [Bacilli bacterium]